MSRPFAAKVAFVQKGFVMKSETGKQYIFS